MPFAPAPELARMRNASELYSQVWQEQVQTGLGLTYKPGANVRVDAAAQILTGGERLLDIGCGAGVLAAALGRRFREVYGVDIAQAAVDAARANGVHAYRVDLDSEPMPFEDSFFDSVTILSVLPYVYDPVDVLRQAHRVLRPGGRLLVSAANMRTVGKLYQQFVRGRFPSASKGLSAGHDGGAMHYFCGGDLERLVERAGFVVEGRKGLYCRPAPMRFLPDLPLLGTLKREFFSGEILLSASKPASSS